MVQEAFVRWAGVNEQEVRSPKEYLSATITRLSIDYLRSARVRREQYVGTWLPEPLVDTQEADPGDLVILTESLSTAFLLMLEKLSPTERAVFLLREVFDYNYVEIARIVGKTAVACRQILHRAQQRVAAERSRFTTDRELAEPVVRRFVDALATGDIRQLLSVLAGDVIARADGGGKIPVARRAVLGAERVARYLVGLTRLAPPGAVYRMVTVGGVPGVVAYTGAMPVALVSPQISAGRVQSVYLILDADKLRAVPPLHWLPPGDE